LKGHGGGGKQDSLHRYAIVCMVRWKEGISTTEECFGEEFLCPSRNIVVVLSIELSVH
jgi:hypothetical protein